MVRLLVVAAIMSLCARSAFCQPEPVGPELVTNGGFEDGGTAWVGGLELVSQPVHSGEHAAALQTVSAGSEASVKQYWVPIEPRKHYRFRMAVRRTTGAGYLYARLLWKSGPEEELRSSDTWNAGAVSIATVRTGEAVGHWREMVGVFRAERSDVAGVNLTITLDGADTVYLDDFSIREVRYPAAPEWELPEAVMYPGHPAGSGMSVEAAEREGQTFTITTTGAEYILEAPTGAMSCRQRIGAQREVAVASFGGPMGELRIAHLDQDVCVVEGQDIALGFQGDSLVTIATNRTLEFGLEGRFGARHLRTLDPHLLAIDELGGVCVMPWARPQADSRGSHMVSGPADAEAPGWSARWVIGARELVGIAVFPPRPFDWDSALKRRVLWAFDESILTPEALKACSEHVSVLNLFAGIYRQHEDGYRWRLPYRADDPEKLHETIDLAHQLGMAVICYRAPLWYGEAGISPADTVADMEAFRAEFGFDGWFLDGHYDCHDWVATWEMMRRLREAVGDGPICTHCTLNPPVRLTELYSPFIDAYSDFLGRGEGQIIQGPSDPYMRYVINSQSISNAIPTLKGDRMLAGTETEEPASVRLQVEAMLRFGGQVEWKAHSQTPFHEDDRVFVDHFLPELDRRQAEWEATGEPPELTWP